MTAEKQDLYGVAITAIVVKGGRFLIIRRSKTKKRLPGMWTVPGGKLERTDYQALPQDTSNAWYWILEKAVAREVKEEVGLKISGIKYLTSLVADYGDAHSVVISMMASYKAGRVRLQKEESGAYAWVSLKQAKEYQLIDGIYDELVMATRRLKGEKSYGVEKDC